MLRFSSIFSQLLQLFSRQDFQKAVRDTKAERHARGFRSWDQFVAMLFCQLGKAHSLREICGGLASCEGRLTQLGAAVPRRATLAYANEHRPWQLFEHVFYQLLARCQAVAWPRTFRFKNKLLSLDATLIELCAEMFPWATYQRTKGAIKLHFTLDHDGHLPTMMVLTEGDCHEAPIAQRQQFDPGTILVFDKAYLDFRWFARLTATRVYFVTRLKTNTTYVVVEQNLAKGRGVLHDQMIALSGRRTRHYHLGRFLLRRIVFQTPEGDILEFLTNHFDFAASTIAAIYKQRWQIELFFKALKQNLRIKTFVGTSSNALHIQIWTALIAILILKYLQLKARFGWSLSNLTALLRMNLFVYRDLWAWLNQPFTAPPPPAEPLQTTFHFT
jgi:hypothetical protein